jgi:hypothetical protein
MFCMHMFVFVCIDVLLFYIVCRVHACFNVYVRCHKLLHVVLHVYSCWCVVGTCFTCLYELIRCL